jgi:hypothetical protein
LAVLACAGLAVAACSSANGGQTMSQYAMPVHRSAEPNVLLAEDIAKVDGRTLDDALRQLRPEILRANAIIRQASMDFVPPSVYVDDRFLGSTDALRLIPVEGVVEVRLVKPFAARGMFGTDCPCAAGVIAVTTRARATK